jgi:hypothetical protein
MASAATPYGLRPIGASGLSPFGANSARQFRLTADNTVAMYLGGPVTMAAGALNGIGANGTAGTPGVNIALGVFMGVQYTDPTLKYTLNAQYVPVSCITAGWTNVLVSVWDDPNALFMIQSDAAVTQAHLGWNANMNFASSTVPGSSTTGISSVSLDTPVNTDNYMLRVVDLVNQNSLFGGGQSVPGDAYTDCIVRWNFGAHIYHNHAVNT